MWTQPYLPGWGSTHEQVMPFVGDILDCEAITSIEIPVCYQIRVMSVNGVPRIEACTRLACAAPC